MPFCKNYHDQKGHEWVMIIKIPQLNYYDRSWNCIVSQVLELYHITGLKTVSYHRSEICIISQVWNLYHITGLKSVSYHRSEICIISQVWNLYHITGLKSVSYHRSEICIISQVLNLYHITGLKSVSYHRFWNCIISQVLELYHILITEKPTPPPANGNTRHMCNFRLPKWSDPKWSDPNAWHKKYGPTLHIPRTAPSSHQYPSYHHLQI